MTARAVGENAGRDRGPLLHRRAGRARPPAPQRHVEFAAGGHEFRAARAPAGVFSAGRLDPGTARAAAQGRSCPARRRRARCSTWAAATALIARVLATVAPACDGVRGRRQRAGPRAGRGPTARRWAYARRAPDEVPDESVRFAQIWSNPADPRRQDRAARAARPAGCPGWRRTAWPGWSSAGTWAATRCTAVAGGAGARQSSGTPARRASGCFEDPK